MIKHGINQKNFCERLGAIPLAKPFLGREYLTWLWYVTETTDQPVQLGGDSRGGRPWTTGLWVDDRILLQSWDLKGHENLLRGGDPSQSMEAAASLCSGKVVRELRLGMNVSGVGDYACTLRADTLTPTGLRLPDDSSGDGAPGKGADETRGLQNGDEAWLNARLGYCDIFLDITDSLFSWFIRERCSATWEETGLRSLQSWITDRRTAGTARGLIN